MAHGFGKVTVSSEFGSHWLLVHTSAHLRPKLRRSASFPGYVPYQYAEDAAGQAIDWWILVGRGVAKPFWSKSYRHPDSCVWQEDIGTSCHENNRMDEVPKLC